MQRGLKDASPFLIRPSGFTCLNAKRIERGVLMARRMYPNMEVSMQRGLKGKSSTSPLRRDKDLVSMQRGLKAQSSRPAWWRGWSLNAKRIESREFCFAALKTSLESHKDNWKRLHCLIGCPRPLLGYKGIQLSEGEEHVWASILPEQASGALNWIKKEISKAKAVYSQYRLIEIT